RTVDILSDRMKKLTAAMEKAIEKGFGMKASGGIVGGAATGGARGSWTMVGEHEPELVRLPFGSRVYSGPDTRRMRQQAWASMLNRPRSAGQAAGAGAPAGAQQIVVHATIEMDGQVVARQIIDPMRKEVVTRGGVRQTFGP
ncbi:phage tail protein, partial [Streptomyces sp. G3]|nr:phage tail protein [Streptomyces sp. G3]